MKTSIIAIVFGILVSATAFAQQRPERSRMTPEERAERISARLTEDLELTEEQAEEVKSIHLKYAKQAEAEREARMQAMKEQHAAMEEEMKAVLSEEQYQKLEEKKEERKSRWEERSSKRKGRPDRGQGRN
jgi:periplasmic protein CpxP/Spy